MTDTYSLTTLKNDIEDFFYAEADLLDGRHFRQWLDLLTDDLRYEVPVRRNVVAGEGATAENTRPGHDVLWFDEDKATLTKRVVQLETGQHWAEEPVSRVSHLVTNVRIVDVHMPTVRTTCRILISRNRVDNETDILIGRREDTLVHTDAGWRLSRRHVLLDQSMLQLKNLTFFL